MSSGYAVASTAKSISRLQHSMSKKSTSLRRASRPYIENRIMKLTFKQRIRNWLMNDDETNDDSLYASTSDSEGPEIQSQGFRLNIYSASGGTIIETTKYDRQKDEHKHSLHVVTDNKELGEELAKIITMESLR
jgi:hypothetical protein